MQHLCESACGVRAVAKAWTVERQDVAGQVWQHGVGGLFLLNRFCLGEKEEEW